MAPPITSRALAAQLGSLPALFVVSAAWLVGLVPADVTPGDSGEIASASYVLGVAHPTGFPVDLLALRAFAFLPLGSIAFRQNVYVALISAAALTAIAAVTVRLCARIGIPWWPARVGALLAVAGLLTFRTFLGTALGVEVYSTSLCLTACAALAALSGGREAGLVWALLGLSFSAHVTAGFLMLPLLAAVLFARSRPLSALVPRVIAVLATSLLIAYLPLAARRDPPLDWGDPSTLSALFAHLTAARIRSSFAHEMFGGAAQTFPAFALARQLSEHAILFAPALLGVFALYTRARRACLVLGTVLAFDLGYAVWINPMGIGDRQVGHGSGAILAICAGVGVAELCARARRFAGLRVLAPISGLLLVAALCWSTAWPARADGYVLGEREGSGSSLTELAPRGIYLCSSDSACASGLFSSHVELVRPDVIVLPAQHLWDHAVLRKLRETLHAMQVVLPAVEPTAPEERAAFASGVLRVLVAHASVQPVFFESDDAIMRASRKLHVAPALPAPLMRVAQTSAELETAAAALENVDALVHARFGEAGPRSTAARDFWFDAYDAVGKSALLAGDFQHAVLALEHATQLAPHRAVGFSNLGVALEARGDYVAAFMATKRALDLDPTRPTAWANLARLSMRVAPPEATRKILAAAAALGIRDARLARTQDTLTLQGAPGSTGK